MEQALKDILRELTAILRETAFEQGTEEISCECWVTKTLNRLDKLKARIENITLK